MRNLNADRHTVTVAATFLLLLAATLAIYWPGLDGDFMFDDYPNLAPLGHYGEITTLEDAGRFVGQGFAGPTGRPVALLSFLLDANHWPADPRPFKHTNLLIHLLNGTVLFAVILLLLRQSRENLPRQTLNWVALSATALWLLHPLHVSTTLYIVQRMTQLSTLFVLLGLLGYLMARPLISTHPVRGHLLATASLAVFGLLALFSKENAILLPLLVLVMELTFLHDRPPDTSRTWKVIVLGLPSLLVVGYLVRAGFRPEAYLLRDFTLGERLLTEPRVLFSYLYQLFVPRMEGYGLFGDSFPVSRSLTEPWTTLPALAGLLGLTLAAVACRTRYPFFAGAWLFFIAGHLIEGTTIPLEIYFEHRNYLPSVFLFLPLCVLFVENATRLSTGTRWLAILAPVLVLASFTANRAHLWGEPDLLYAYWAAKNPQSARAQVYFTNTQIHRGNMRGALEHISHAATANPDSLLLAVQLYSMRAELGMATPNDAEKLENKLGTLVFDHQAGLALRKMIDRSINNGFKDQSAAVLAAFLDAFARNPAYPDRPAFVRMTHHLKGKLLLATGEAEQALEQFQMSQAIMGDAETGMVEVALLATGGHYQEALVHLNTIERDIKAGVSRTKFSPAYYLGEINRIRALLEEEMNP